MTVSGVSIKHLTWDTDFFGFQVARIYRGGEQSLDEALVRLRADGTKLAYFDVAAADAETRDRALQLGARSVGRRVELITQRLNVETPDDVVVLAQCPDAADRRAVHALALASGERSRFRLDPGITDIQFAELYAIWIENGINRCEGESVLVSRVDQQVGGMISIAVREGVGVIGLFAVDAAHRGQGLGRRLLRGALAWAAQHGALAVHVTTQGDNAGALAVYGAMGFEIHRISDTLHFWI